jgi:hypothetical protein
MNAKPVLSDIPEAYLALNYKALLGFCHAQRSHYDLHVVLETLFPLRLICIAAPGQQKEQRNLLFGFLLERATRNEDRRIVTCPLCVSFVLSGASLPVNRAVLWNVNRNERQTEAAISVDWHQQDLKTDMLVSIQRSNLL